MHKKITQFFTQKNIPRKLETKQLLMVAAVVCAVAFMGYLLFVSSQYHGRRVEKLKSTQPNQQQYEIQKQNLEYAHATVLDIVPGNDFVEENLKVKITSGTDKGKVILVDRFAYRGDQFERRPTVGSDVYIFKDGPNADYMYDDRNRLPGAGLLFALMLIAIILIGRKRGVSSVIGLSVSVAILALYVVPRIVAGNDAYSTCVQGAFGIAVASIFIAHGFNKRTTVAFFGTTITLLFTVLFANFSHYITYLSGMSGEEALALSVANSNISFAGILFGGIVIATLGVLNDITIGQAASVDEIYRAKPKQSFHELYNRGMSVGREHVAALVNTLALAYMGVALPTVLIISFYNSAPLAVLLNNEFIMVEVVRTIVVSIGTLLAVPFTTALAAYILPKWERL